MIPTVGVVYKFEFVPGFTSFNGIYHVGQILTFQESLSNERSIVETFFTPAGKLQEDYNNDLSLIRDAKILKLMNPDTLASATAIYVPLIYVASEPDFNVKKYYTLAVGLNLGIHDNPEQLSYITDALSQEFQATTGISAAPELFEISTAWMTNNDYESIEDTRKQNITKVLNYFTEVRRLQDVITGLRSKILAYEEIIKTHIPANGG